ncbi:glycolate oxidase subunit GlcF [Ralstonia solanacearum]|uniref:glycolate oxidase subunit GlcF n=1 Tax=Ralstonia solanacearum TaxID=305 RepID=UPI00078DC33C|nr:glycolate oxidase subunit GlcF [Ralstonia solanacearum]AMP36703.1 glycolate oxidase iron-sulfur subunit [Ralstonia solanacearum]AXV85506.1 glycolate oxidase iron-sulfur subunit [Ralstonia solanacearum]AXW05018.1 glycolate oxidase iron-sulfur subunit [Ralstonia solanacearum]AXW22764.1 glycolate oxidase iron-sulfur subunit [Ralstonia solanacearum]AXW79709.1 glycolate oxidase iron-sulfur subunit [Ralstonia solanacearum]
MQITLAAFLQNTPDGEEAQGIVQKCVHCGFCTATCPTYQLLGDELDGPRGRIYLMKQVLEGQPAGERTRLHLDRCLTCRNCESTCPSGVTYGRLVEIGRKIVDDQLDAKGASRPLAERAVRWVLREGLTRPGLFGPALKLGQAVRPLLPPVLRNKVPAKAPQAGTRPTAAHARKMLLLEGCVQPAMSPNINAATARVFDRLGVQLISAPRAGCCGAIRYHMNDHAGGLGNMRANIDAWWPHIEAGAEAIVMTASGCGAMVKEYGHLLRDDPAYAERAARVSAMTRDLCEVLPAFSDPLLQQAKPAAQRPRVAWHAPCTLQHGQQIRGVVERLLTSLGVDVRLCTDSHLCCGSAGTYSVLQPGLAYQLRDDKLRNLLATQPERIVSANIGCVTHLQSGTDTPVEHWIELVDRMLAG